MLDIKIKDKVLQEHRESTVKELIEIRNRLAIKTLQTFELDEVEELKEAIEELNVYIDFISKTTIGLDDTVISVIGKSYLIFQTVPGVLEVFNNLKKEYGVSYGIEINESYIRAILNNNFSISYNKAFNFAREINLRKKYKIGYKKDWKSTTYVADHVIKELEKRSKEKKKVENKKVKK